MDHLGPIDPRSDCREFKKLLGKAGLPPVRLHDLRDMAASLLVAQSVPPRVVMENLGRTQIALTMNTYSHVAPAVPRRRPTGWPRRSGRTLRTRPPSPKRQSRRAANKAVAARIAARLQAQAQRQPGRPCMTWEQVGAPPGTRTLKTANPPLPISTRCSCECPGQSPGRVPRCPIWSLEVTPILAG